MNPNDSAITRFLWRRWWAGHPDAWMRALQPLASVLQTGAAWRSRRAQARAAWPTPVPTVVVGNWVLGGAGKTPITLALVRHLQQRGFRPGIVSRGYGGPTVADSEAPVFIPANAAEPGGADEALLLARRTGVPVAIHPRRHRAREALCARHPEVDVVVADDALQHRALSRDLEVVAVDERGLGNGLTLPAGPLRERPYRAERTLWLYVGAPALAGWPGHQARRRLSPPLPWRAWAADPNGALSPEAGHSATPSRGWSDWTGRAVHAAAGIAVPERFFAFLRAQGLEVEPWPLADHDPMHRLPWPDDGRPVLVTEKDAVKLHRHPQALNRVWVVPLDLDVDADFWAAFDRLLPWTPDSSTSSSAPSAKGP